jgi:hypothetical protein
MQESETPSAIKKSERKMKELDKDLKGRTKLNMEELEPEEARAARRKEKEESEESQQEELHAPRMRYGQSIQTALYMELESTVNYLNIDIQRLLQSSTLEDFLTNVNEKLPKDLPTHSSYTQ